MQENKNIFLFFGIIMTESKAHKNQEEHLPDFYSLTFNRYPLLSSSELR